jgi:3-methylcrotonyl-CoA carboxylase alpha subunit
MMNRHIDTLLVANRGEIACRVMRTAKAMGLTTVAVHSAIDASARHAREADIRIDLGGAKPADSYLRVDKLIEAARPAVPRPFIRATVFSRRTLTSPARSSRPG